MLGAVTLVVLLLGAVPVFDAFDAPLDPLRWYVGVPNEPRRGRLPLPKEGWIVARGIDDERVAEIEIAFRTRGGSLEVTFHDAKEPLSSPRGDALVVRHGGGERTLSLTREGARLDGESIAWAGTLGGTFRLRAVKGAVELDEVRVAPRVAEPAEPPALERATVHFLTTPHLYTDGEHRYGRVTLLLWDAEVAFLFRRGEPSFAPLRGPPKGAPVLGALVTGGESRALALKASGHPLAMRDWGDERGNLSSAEFLQYVGEEYATFAVLMEAQRALNAAVPERDDLEPLVHLAVVRHADNAHAATALAETQGAKKALALLRDALGKGTDPARASGDQLRAAAGAAAQALLGEPPAQWPRFRFEPRSRYATLQQAKELTR